MAARAGVLLLVSCGGPSDSATSSGTPVGTPLVGEPTTTGLPTPTTVSVSCLGRDNALIFDCVALLPSEGAATAFLQEPTGGLRSLDAVQDGARLDFVVWRLVPETDYTVRVQPGSGAELQTQITSGAVPEAHAVAPVLTGTPTWDFLLLPHECSGGPNLLLIDSQGEVVWYLEVTEGMTGLGFKAVDGFDWTEDDTVLAVLGRTRVREWSWTQDLLLDLSWPGALTGPVHHDVIRRGGHTFVLTADTVTGADGIDYVMDGVLVYDAAGVQVASWSLADRYAPSGGVVAPGGYWGTIFPNAWDWAHTNGITVEPDGDWLLSSRIHNAVIRVTGDWNSGDFGQVVWALSADPGSALGSDFSVGGAIGPANFQGQHHPGRDGRGRLTLFDNRDIPIESSRATVWDLDEPGRTATLVAAWSLGEHCTVQGSVFQVGASDDVVATCASSQSVYEFSPLQADPVASLQIPCAASGTRPLVVRAQPVSFAP